MSVMCVFRANCRRPASFGVYTSTVQCRWGNHGKGRTSTVTVSS